MQKFILIFLGGLIVGGLIVWGIFEAKGIHSTPSPDMVATSTLETNDSVTVMNQAAGDTVQVTDVSLTNSAWIVVYDNNAGAPGNTLGAIIAIPSEGEVSVPLLRPTISGHTYFVGIASFSTTTPAEYSTTLPTIGTAKSFIAQ